MRNGKYLLIILQLLFFSKVFLFLLSVEDAKGRGIVLSALRWKQSTILSYTDIVMIPMNEYSSLKY